MHSNQENKVYIGGLDKAELFAELYNNAKIQGRGFLGVQRAVNVGNNPGNISIEEARTIIGDRVNEFNVRDNLDIAYLLSRNPYDFDYFRGRALKIDLCGNYLDTWLYNGDNGQGLAEKIVEELRKKQVSSQVATPQVESHIEERGK